MDDPHDPIDLSASAPKKVKKKADHKLAVTYVVITLVVALGVVVAHLR